MPHYAFNAILSLLCYTKPTICYTMLTINKTITHSRRENKSTPANSLAAHRVKLEQSRILYFLAKSGVPFFGYRSRLLSFWSWIGSAVIG